MSVPWERDLQKSNVGNKDIRQTFGFKPNGSCWHASVPLMAVLGGWLSFRFGGLVMRLALEGSWT